MASVVQPSFARGEIAPSLYGRVDLAMYQVALRTARNVIVHPQGGASNRSGTRFIGPVRDHSYAPRLIHFSFKTTDKYELEFGNQYMRVIRDDGYVLETAVAITGATQANPVVLTTGAAHGWADGDIVFVQNVTGMTQLNGRWFVVRNPGAQTIELEDQILGGAVNGTGYGAYLSGGTAARVFELATPYAIADVPLLKFTQSADVMTLTHAAYDPLELRRTGHTAWTLAEIAREPKIGFPRGQAVVVESGGDQEATYKVTAIDDDTGEESLAALSVTGSVIVGITRANPAVVTTAAAHNLRTGDEVYLESIVGMTELNGRRFTVGNTTSVTFQLRGEDSSGYAAYTSGGTSWPTFVRVTNSNNPATALQNRVTWQAVGTAERYFIYRNEGGGYGWVGETENLLFRDRFTFNPDYTRGPPRFRDPFRKDGDQPGAVGYHEQRRVFGGSTNGPDTSVYSQTGRHSNFLVSSPLQADDAITATLAHEEVNEIRHFVAGNDLLVLTSGGEWRVTAGPDSAFSAESIRQKPQSAWGSSHQRPIRLGSIVLFVEESGREVRSIGYSFQVDGYVSSRLNLLAEHFLRRHRITDWAGEHAPDPRIYMVANDGHVLTMAFDPEQDVNAWTHWTTLGRFEAVSSLRHGTDPEQGEDALYFVVRRILPGGRVVRFVERLASRNFDDIRDAFFVDSGLTLDNPVAITGITATDPVVVTAPGHGFQNGDEVDLAGIEWELSYEDDGEEITPTDLHNRRFTVANATTDTFELEGEDGTGLPAYVMGGEARKVVTEIGGLWHLEGMKIVALADGNVVKGLVVAQGKITLPNGASRVHAGLPYSSEIETLDIEVQQTNLQGRLKNIVASTVRVERSRGFLIGPNKEQLDEVKVREDEAYGQPTDLFTGDRRVILDGTWNTKGRILIRQPNPLPLTVLAVIPELEVADD